MVNILLSRFGKVGHRSLFFECSDFGRVRLSEMFSNSTFCRHPPLPGRNEYLMQLCSLSVYLSYLSVAT